MKHMALQNENMQNLMEYRDAGLISKDVQNQLRQAAIAKDAAQLDKYKIETEKKTADHMREGLAWAIPQVETTDSAAPYEKYREHMLQISPKLEKVIPSSSLFYDEKPDLNAEGGKTQVFNKDRFKSWANNSMMTAANIASVGVDALKDKYQPTTVYLPDGSTVVHMLDKHSKDPFKPEDIYGKGATVEKPSYENEKDSWDEPYKGPGGTLLQKNKKTGKVVAAVGRAPESAATKEDAKKPHLTGNVGINPATNKEEYLMSDGSFSGTAPGAKPKSAGKGGLAGLEASLDGDKKGDKKIDLEQEKKYVAEAIAKNPSKADAYKAKFKSRTGKEY
jgi:hypothetical protein